MKKTSVIAVIVLSLCVLVLCLGTSNTFAQRQETNPIGGSAAPLPMTDPPVDKGLEIKLWTDKGNQNPTYYIGERIYISFSVNRDCYILLYSVDSTGKVNILFPNPYHPDNLVRKGRIYTLPASTYKHELFVKGPSGQESLFAVASSYTFYHWQYCDSPPPLWSNEWGVYSIWDSPSGSPGAAPRHPYRGALEAQGNSLAALTIQYMQRRSDELSKMHPLVYTECKFFVTFSLY